LQLAERRVVGGDDLPGLELWVLVDHLGHRGGATVEVDLDGLPAGGVADPADAGYPPDDAHDREPTEQAGDRDEQAGAGPAVGGDEQVDRAAEDDEADEDGQRATDLGLPGDGGEGEVKDVHQLQTSLVVDDIGDLLRGVVLAEGRHAAAAL